MGNVSKQKTDRTAHSQEQDKKAKTEGLLRPRRRGRNWFIASGALAGVMALIVLLNLPIVTVARESVEPYYTTETNYCPCVLTEYVKTETSIQKEAVISDACYAVVPAGITIPFQIDRPGSRLIGKFENSIPGSFLIYSYTNHILWEKLGSRGIIDLALPPGNYTAKFQENIMWGEDVYIYLAITWNELESRLIAQEKSTYCETPVVINNERVVLKQDKCSIWQLITDS